jgi:co-chaperonin GroES (HSP10)
MEKSKYLKAFEGAAKEVSDTFELIGDFLIVEEIKDDEMKSKGGIIIASGTQSQVNGLAADKPTFARVLMVGAGFYDDTKDNADVPVSVLPGDIILVGRHSIKKFSVFGKLMSYGETDLGLTKESEIQLRFKGEEGFERFFRYVNQSVEKKMEQ